MEDFPRSGKPLTSSAEVKIAQVKEKVTENSHSRWTRIAADFSVYRIFLRVAEDMLERAIATQHS